MKLISILRVMDEVESIKVLDGNAPLTAKTLYEGYVGDCKKYGYFRNGVVTSLCAYDDILIIGVNIEYQNTNKIEQENAERKDNGEWGFDGMSWTCSECGEYAPIDKNRQTVKSKFCPNCGAKMKGGASDG